MKNIIQRIVSLLCVILILLSLCISTVVAVGNNSVTATTSSSAIKQGNYAYCYVYIDSLAELAALDVTVHYDNTKISIVNTYNKINCTLYDSAVNADNISFNYILDGNGADGKTQLFYFRYRVLNNAEAGSSYFDISVGEAYDSGLNDVAVTGSRCRFTISESATSKSCTVSSTRTVSSSIDQEFSLTYRFSTYQLASGSAVITYDAELFEPVSVTAGNFLNNKITDINTDLVGSIYVSFVGSQYNSYYDFLTVTFKTIKNTNYSSEIVMKVTDLCDLDLNTVSCSGYTTTANVVYDDTYIKDAPKMSVQVEYLLETNQILATVFLEEKSHLGAGDFVLNFDTELMTLNSYEKKFNPTFFNVNDKNANEGKLKFSIISLEDITDSQPVLTAVFDCSDDLSVETISVNIEGSGLTDSLTNPIKLNLIDGSDYIDYVVTFMDSDGSIISESVYQYENIISIPAVPEKDGYVFVGWSPAVPSKMPTTNMTFTAVFELATYTATFIADGAVISTQTFTIETESLDEPPVPQKAGYYACWSCYTIEAKDITIIAKYYSPEAVMISKRTLDVGDTYRLLPSCNFEVTDISWMSSDTSVATVNQHGKVTAVGEGECRVTVTCYGKDSFGNDIQASKSAKIIVNGKSETTNIKQSFREMFDEFFEVTLHDILYIFREFMIVLLRYAY